MKKKAYITPGINEMAVDPENLMLKASGEGIKTDPDDYIDTSNDDNRSRLTYEIWEDEDLSEEF